MSAVSHSRVESYLTCRRKDYYGYQWPNEDGSRGIRRIRTSESLALGSCVHVVLAAYYGAVLEGADHYEAMDVAQIMLEKQYDEGYENAGGRYEDIEVILMRYFDNEPFATKGYEILAVEQEFRLEYDTDTDSSYPFVVDLIVRDPRGKVAIVDHKTGYNLYSEVDLELLPQVAKYIAGVRALGYPAAYGIYNVLRTQKVNGGKMLKAEIVECIAKHIADQGKTPDPKELAKMMVPQLTGLAESMGIIVLQPPEVDQILQQLEFNPNPTRVERSFIEQMGVAEEIQARDAMPIEMIERTAWRIANKMVCQNCQFRTLCVEELRGGNVKAALANDYEPKPRREAIVLSNGDEEDE